MVKKTGSNFGDKRLEKVFGTLLDRMQSRHSVVLSQLGLDNAQEVQFGRFINNIKVTPDRILEQYWKSSSLDLSKKHLLVISDSSTLSFKTRADREPLGPLAGTQSKEGFEMHPSILVDAQNGGCYGLAGIDFYQDERSYTEQDERDKLKRRKQIWKIPFEDKQSYKWFRSVQKGIANCSGAQRYTLIGDREADIYELMHHAQAQGWDFLYRSRQDRTIVETQGAKTLYDLVESWQAAHIYEVEVGSTCKRSAHKAQLAIKYGAVSILRPRNKRIAGLAKQQDIYVVEAKEIPQSVIGDEAPIHWRLLSSHPIQSVEDAIVLLQWYCRRWVIEQCFRTLKLKGMDIEASSVKTYHGLQNLSTLALIIALQTMQLVEARDGQSKQEIQATFLAHEIECLEKLGEKLNGKTRKSQNPYPKNTLAYAAWIIARLGGWKGYQSKKPPGPITFFEGLARFYQILEGYYLFRLN